MTTIGVTFGGSDFSEYVFSADMWRDNVAGIGTWEALMDPGVNYWPWNLPFTPGNPVVITIEGSTMMEGVIDDVEAYVEGVRTNIWKLSGRDWGYELGSRVYTAPRGDYVNLRADDIINRVFTAVGTNITPPVAPFTAPFINYEWKPNTFLGDGVRDIADMVNYDFYVADNDPARTLHFFPQGAAAEHTGAVLEMLNNSLTNNILKFEMGERLASGLANYLILGAGGLTDHWTDLNASDWTPRGGTAIIDYYGPGLSRLEGKASLQALATVNNNITTITLDLSGGLYDQGGSVDISKPCMGRYDFLCHYPTTFPLPGVGAKKVRLILEDIAGQQIRFYRTITAPLSRNSDATQTIWNDFWQICDKIPFGEQNVEQGLGLPNATKGYWIYERCAPPPAFDWSQVTKIIFTTYDIGGISAGDYFLVDGLTIPSINVESIDLDAVSIASPLGRRDKHIYRPDIGNQVELDAASAAMLPTLVYPLEKATVTATGQVISDYAGQSLNLEVTDYGIAANTRYRISQLHHSVRKNSAESEVPGWNFLTDYELIRDEYTSLIGGKQYYDAHRFLNTVDPRRAATDRLRLQQKYRERNRVNIG